MPKRDDFSPGVKTRLKEAVASICSNPACRVFTIGAHTDPSKKEVSIGVAAHICAAAPGGPRYDDGMTQGQRVAYANGIWLCQKCARLIDRDTARFKTPVLHQWKADSEALARQNIGQRVPSKRDASDQLVMALSGLPTSNQPNVISNAHLAYRTVLEETDPRFQVETSFLDGITRITLNPVEPVRIKFKVGDAAASTWQDGISNLVKHGRPVQLPADDVRVHGSPIFEKLHPSEFTGAKIIFSPDGRLAVAKLSLRDPISGVLLSLDDAIGSIAAGTETATFTGGSCGGLLTIRLELPRESPADGTFTITTDFERWVNRDVRVLPYFDKVFHFYERAKEGWIADLTLEIEGSRVFGAIAEMPVDDDVFMFTSTTLAYCNRARVLTEHIGRRLEFRLDPPFSAEDHKELAELANIARGKHVFNADEVSPVKHLLKAEADGANIRILKEHPGPHTFAMTGAPNTIAIYGQELDLPHLRRVFQDVTAEIDGELASFPEGSEVPVTWKKGPAFRITHEFESASQLAERLATEKESAP